MGRWYGCKYEALVKVEGVSGSRNNIGTQYTYKKKGEH